MSGAVHGPSGCQARYRNDDDTRLVVVTHEGIDVGWGGTPAFESIGQLFADRG